MTKEYRKQYGYSSPYARKVDLTTMARLRSKHIAMTEDILDAKFPVPGQKPSHRRLKTEEIGERVIKSPPIESVNPHLARQIRLTMRQCDITSLEDPNSKVGVGSFSPTAMEEALRRNILYHKQYDPRLDSKANKQVCKHIL